VTDFFFELDDGREVRVEGNYVPGSRGARSSLGVPEEMDDPADFEIVLVRDALGKVVVLSEGEELRAVEEGVREAEQEWCDI
jgi:hypothetical protein